MNEQLEQACALLRECIDEKIQDKSVREAVYMLLDAHENAKQVVSMLRGQLERTYETLDRITANPEFRKLMESMKNDGKA
jgi:chemotaxis regulatin CheY-phosphate phosphatase CheZ